MRIADVQLDLRGSGRGWVITWQGGPVSRAYSDHDSAIAGMRRVERRLATAVRPRACLCCGIGFESEGPHHRLCGRCRREG
ncbi:MAG TPA: hypothetical protein PKC84_00445 [Paracoccaceae bacterium]|nr:hypothetical protein [Paracoccaceae bacterium]